MKAADYIVIALIAAAVIRAVILCIRQKSRPCCGGSCEGCGRCGKTEKTKHSP